MIGPNHRSNSFDLIRHGAALAVLVAHHYALSRFPTPQFWGIFSYGAFAVLVFFAISGYLVTKSYWNSTSFWTYFEKRLRRLFPALIVCSALMVVILYGFMGQQSPALKFIFSERAYNAFMAHVWLDGSRDINKFSADFKYPNAANGSLWTLRYEFFSYIIIPCTLILFRKSYKGLIALLALCILLQTYSAITNEKIVSIWRQTLLMTPFLVGALMFFTEEHWNNTKTKLILFLACLTMIAITPRNPAYQMVFYVCLSIITILIGISFKENLIAGKFDISYGIYIYAFPVQQIIINKTTLSFYPSMAAAAAITLLLATASWYWVEKPFLKRHHSSSNIKTHDTSDTQKTALASSDPALRNQ